MALPLPAQSLVSSDQLGLVLRNTRKRLTLTQAAVGVRLNLSQNRVSHLEQHPEELSFKQLLTWCSALGLELKVGVRDGGGARERQSSDW